MPKAIYDDVLRFLHHACGLKGGGDKPDRELVERYLSHEEAAFSLLMQRHGPMILGICRRLAADPHAAEDGFQATFMVLIRQAASIRKKESLAPWLHGVARRLVLKARAKAAANRRREERTLPMTSPDPVQELTIRELRSCLDEEISQLPVKYQTPILLSYFEGKSYSQAAQEIGCPKSTFTNRLNRGLERLRRQLSRRGITLAGAALASALTEAAAAPPLPAILAVNTMKAAALLGGSKAVACGCLTATALALAEEALTGMLVVKVKIVMLAMTLALALGGGGLAGYKGLAASRDYKLGDNQQQNAPASRPVAESQAQAKDKKERLDANGEPMPEGMIARLGAVRFRHDGSARKLAYSADGKSLLGFTSSGIVVWDAVTGRERQRVAFQLPDGNGVGLPAFSLDGSKAALADPRVAADKLKVVNLQNGKESQTLPWPKSSGKKNINLGKGGMVFSRDGKLLGGIFFDQNKKLPEGKLFLFDLESGEVRSALGGEDNSIGIFTFAPDGQRVVAADIRGNRILSWEIATNKVQELVALPKAPNLLNLAFSEDGKKLAVDADGQISILNPDTGKEFGNLGEFPREYTEAMFFFDKGTKLIALMRTIGRSSSGVVRIWDQNSGKLLDVYSPGKQSDFRSMALSPDGKTLALGTYTNTLRFWNMISGKEVTSAPEEHDNRISRLYFTADGKSLISFSSYGRLSRLNLWDTTTWRREGGYSGDFGFGLSFDDNALVLSPDGRKLLKILADGKVALWDWTTDKEFTPLSDEIVGRSSMSEGKPFLAAGAFSPNGGMLFTLEFQRADKSKQFRVRHWDVATGQKEMQWQIRYEGLGSMILQPDGKTLLLSDLNTGTIEIHDLVLGTKRTYKGKNRADVDAPALSPDGRILALGLEETDSGVRLLDTLTGNDIFVLKAPNPGGAKRTAIIAWSPDGRLLATGDRRSRYGNQPPAISNQRIYLWNTADGAELTAFGDLPTDVSALQFSPDGKILAAGLADGTALVFDISKFDAKARQILNLTQSELESQWDMLMDNDGGNAQKALWILANSSKQSLPFLQGKLKPVSLFDQIKIQKWIADLDSETFTVRQAAAQELVKVGDQVQAPIQNALQGKPSLETRRRLEQVLKSLPDIPGPETIRTIRAIMALERIGTPEARDVLEALARGAPGARETEEARGSVERLARRRK